MGFTAVHDGQEYLFDARWLLMALAGMVLAIAVTIAILVARRRWARARLEGWALLSVVVGGVVACVVTSVPLLYILTLGVNVFFDAALRRTSAWELFAELCVAELAASALASIAATVAFFAVAPRRPPTGRRALAAALAVGLFLPWSLAQAGLLHAHLLGLYNRLPSFEDQHVEWIHEGQTLELQPALRNNRRGPPLVARKASPLRGAAGDRLELIEEAENPYLSIRKRSSLAVKRELGPPGFPLRVGNRWDFQHLRHDRTRVLLVIAPERSAELEDGWILEIVKARVRLGVREFRLESRIKQDHRTGWWVRAVDGELSVLRQNGQATAWEIPPPGSDVDFALPLKAETTCHGVVRATSQTAVSGPCACSRGQDRTARGIVTALTLGIVIPDSTDVWRLVGSRAGPSDAPAAALTAPLEVVAFEPPTCPPDPETTRLCLRGQTGFFTGGRARRLVDRLRGEGVSAGWNGGEALIEATLTELGDHLGLTVGYELRDGLCPTDARCVPRLDRGFATALRAEGITRLALDEEACRGLL